MSKINEPDPDYWMEPDYVPLELGVYLVWQPGRLSPAIWEHVSVGRWTWGWADVDPSTLARGSRFRYLCPLPQPPEGKRWPIM